MKQKKLEWKKQTPITSYSRLHGGRRHRLRKRNALLQVKMQRDWVSTMGKSMRNGKLDDHMNVAWRLLRSFTLDIDYVDAISLLKSLRRLEDYGAKIYEVKRSSSGRGVHVLALIDPARLPLVDQRVLFGDDPRRAERDEARPLFARFVLFKNARAKAYNLKRQIR